MTTPNPSFNSIVLGNSGSVARPLGANVLQQIDGALYFNNGLIVAAGSSANIFVGGIETPGIASLVGQPSVTVYSNLILNPLLVGQAPSAGQGLQQSSLGLLFFNGDQVGVDNNNIFSQGIEVDAIAPYAGGTASNLFIYNNLNVNNNFLINVNTLFTNTSQIVCNSQNSTLSFRGPGFTMKPLSGIGSLIVKGSNVVINSTDVTNTDGSSLMNVNFATSSLNKISSISSFQSEALSVSGGGGTIAISTRNPNISYLSGDAQMNLFYGFTSLAGNVICLDPTNQSNVGVGTLTPAYKFQVATTNDFYVDPIAKNITAGTSYNVKFLGDVSITAPSGSRVQIGTTGVGSLATAVGILSGAAGQGATAIGYQAGQLLQSSFGTAIGYQAGQNGQGSWATALGFGAGSYQQQSNSVSVGYLAGNYAQGSQAIAIGFKSGTTSQQANAVAIGILAGQSSQGSYGVAIGNNTGQLNQGSYAIAIGSNAATISQGYQGIAIGSNAGVTSQGYQSLAIGSNAGVRNQGYQGISIGSNAGATSQGFQSLAIGIYSGELNQNIYSIAIGTYAGQSAQGSNCIALGSNAGTVFQSNNSIAIGTQAATTSQFSNSVAVGYGAGQNYQGLSTVAVGTQAGSSAQGSSGISVGTLAGQLFQGTSAIAMGSQAGNYYQGSYAVALGYLAGTRSQNNFSIAMGYQAGQSGQAIYTTAIGYQAGQSGQGCYSIAIGQNSGFNGQGCQSVAIGSNAGVTNQGYQAVAIGANAGNSLQGFQSVAIGAGAQASAGYSVAIGAGAVASAASQICINGTSQTINISSNSGLFINPIRYTNVGLSNILTYSQSTKELTDSGITFLNGNVGFRNTSPSNLFCIGSNTYFTEFGSNTIVTVGNVSADFFNGNGLYITNTIGVTTSAYAYGSGSLIPVITTNSKGQITNITNTTITATTNLEQASTLGNATLNTLLFQAKVGFAAIGNVSIGNASSTSNTLTVGSNLFVTDGGANVLSINGNVAVGWVSGNASLMTSLTGVSPGPYGGPSSIPIITIDANGKLSTITTTGVISTDGINTIINNGNSVTGSRTLTFTNSPPGTTAFTTTSNVGICNTNPIYTLCIGANVIVSDEKSNLIILNGNISANYFTGNGVLISSLLGSTIAGTYGGNGNISQIVTNSRGQVTSISNSAINIGFDYVSNVVNTTVATILFKNATGFAASGNVSIGNASSTSNTLTVGSNLFVTDTGANVLSVNGNISTISYIFANKFSGDGSLLTNVQGTSNLNQVAALGNATLNTLLFQAKVGFAASGNVSIANTSSTSNTLTVGSNLFVTDGAPGTANLLFIKGNFGTTGNIVVTQNITCGGTFIGLTQSNLAQVVNNGNISTNSIIIGGLKVGGNTFITDILSNILAINGNIACNTFTSNVLNVNGPLSATSVLTSCVVVQTGSIFGIIAGSNTLSASTITATVGLTTNNFSLNNSNVAIGVNAGVSQGLYAIAIGQSAGNSGQNTYAIAIGQSAGLTGQYNAAIAIGVYAGISNQGLNAVAIGQSAGALNGQGNYSVAVGYFAGRDTQGLNAVAIGVNAGSSSQNNYSVAIGNVSGNSSQGSYGVAIGNSAGQSTQGSNSVAIGYAAGLRSQGPQSIAIGQDCGKFSQGDNSVAIGSNAGATSQGIFAVAIGDQAGQSGQGAYAIAIGQSAGYCNQETDSIAIGTSAGYLGQDNGAIGIGRFAGYGTTGPQKEGAIAIGYAAQGGTGQGGSYSICIGANSGPAGTPNNSITLDASGLGSLNPTTSGFFVSPVTTLFNSGNVATYNQSTNQFADCGGITISTNSITFNAKNLIPSVTNSKNLGSSALAWSAVYSYTYPAPSDIRYKDATPLKYGLNELLLVNPIQYTWKITHIDDPSVHLGFSAQELLSIFPETVDINDSNIFCVCYNEIVPINTQAIKDLHAIIISTGNEINSKIIQLQSNDIQNNSNISQLQSDVTKTNSNINQLESNVLQNSSNINQLKTDVIKTNSNISQLQSDVTKTNSNINQLESNVLQNSSNISQLKTDVIKTNSNINQIQSTINSEISQIQIDIIKTSSNINQVISSIVQTNSNVLQTNSNVSQLKTDVIKTNSNINQIQSTINSEISKLESNINFEINKINTTINFQKNVQVLDIPHPLFPKTKKRLIHNYISGSRCDVIYRNTVTLANGMAFVDLDLMCTETSNCAMSQGTFQALCKNPQIFLQNTSSFDRVIGSIFGNLLNINCENMTSQAIISWMVVAERNDPFITSWSHADVNGSLISEYNSE